MEGEAWEGWGTPKFTWKCSLSSRPASVKCCPKVMDLHKILTQDRTQQGGCCPC